MEKQSRRQFIFDLGVLGLAVNRAMARLPATIYGPWIEADANTPRSSKPQSLEQKVSGIQSPEDTAVNATSQEIGVHYFAVSANENPLYVNLNLQVLRMHGYNVFIEKDSVSGLYRTIIATTLPKVQLQRKLAELERFDIGNMWERHYDTRSSKSLEELSNKIESESNNFVNGLERDQYVAQLVPLVRKARRYNNGKEHVQMDPENVLELIYDAAHEFKVPLSEFTAIIYGESSFRNIKGDLHLGSNFSEGIGQMRKTTQRYVFTLMKQAGIQGLPQKQPQSVLPDPRLQARMSAFYFAHCIQKADGDIRGGIAKYNAGQDSNNPNKAYVINVQSRHRDVERLLQ